MKILFNIVFFFNLPYNYGKSVLSDENLMALLCSGDDCGTEYVKSFKIK